MSRLRPAPAAVSSPEPDGDIVERQAEHVGGHLRHDRVGAGADVGERDTTSACPLAVGTMRGGACTCSASQMPVAIPSRPARCRRASSAALHCACSSRSCGALPVAFAQVLAGIGNVLVLVAVRVAPQAQLQRIELERHRKLVHRAFECIDAGGRARRAHVRRGWQDRAAPACANISRLRFYKAGRTTRCRRGKNPGTAT